MNRSLYYVVMIVLMHVFIQSCASKLPRDIPIPCEDEFPDLFSAAAPGTGISIVGKVRIELPRYRVRGICRIRYSSPGRCRIDFQHSSLFGAYREDASIIIRGGRMVIYDRERGNFFGNDSSLSLLRRHFEFNVYPEDILVALLLDPPECYSFTDLDFRGSGDQWRLTGEWRRRHVEIIGERNSGPLSFRQCSGDVTGCYYTSYSYNIRDEGIRYPARIAFRKESGSGRMSLTTTEVSEELFSREVFEPGNTVERSPD